MRASQPLVEPGETTTPLEAHLRHVIETQPVCLTRIAPDGTFLAVNEAALSMLGAERLEQVLGTSVVDMVEPAHRDQCRAFLKRMSDGGRGSTEVDFTGLGGLRHTLQIHAISVSIPPDGIASAMCTFRDVTEHRRLERALMDAAAREEALSAAHAAECARLTVDLERARLDAADATAHGARIEELEQELARAASDLARRHDQGEQHEERANALETALRSAEARLEELTAAREADRAEWQRVEAEQSRQLAALRASLERAEGALADAASAHERQLAELHAAAGGLEHAIGEATARADAAAGALERERNTWEQLRADSAAEIEALRARLSALEAERAASAMENERVTAEQSAELARLDALLAETIADRDARAQQVVDARAEREELERQIADALAGRTAAEGHAAETVARHQALEGRAAEALAAVQSLEGQVAQALVERQALERQARRTERLARAGRVAASIAGDLEALLGRLADQGRALAAAVDARDGRRAALERVAQTALEGASLARQIAAETPGQAYGAGVDVAAVLREFETTLGAVLAPDVALAVLSAADGETGAAATRDDLEQLLFSLAANRRAAMPGGGQVTFEVAPVEIDEACARERGGVEPGAYILLACHASGPGVEAGTPAALVGAPSGEAAWRAAGPGMATVYRVAAAAGGYLWATSEGPDAAAFEVYLPRAGTAGSR